MIADKKRLMVADAFAMIVVILVVTFLFHSYSSAAQQDKTAEQMPVPQAAMAATVPEQQTSPEPEPVHTAFSNAIAVADYCQNLAATTARPEALKSACQFALTVQQKLPNYICDEKIKRWADKNRGYLNDEIKAEVTVERGRESYSNIRIEAYSTIRINGKASDHMLPKLPGMLSAGEFGMQWPLLFKPENKATFKFKKEVKLDSRPAFLFSFEVRAGENKSFNVWDLDGVHWNPGYSGSMWVDKATLRPVQLEMFSTRVPFRYFFQKVKATARYGEVPLVDGTTFLLPITSSVLACGDPVRNTACMKPGQCQGYGFGEQCLRNDLEFTNCHKFAAKTLILSVE